MWFKRFFYKFQRYCFPSTVLLSIHEKDHHKNLFTQEHWRLSSFIFYIWFRKPQTCILSSSPIISSGTMFEIAKVLKNIILPLGVRWHISRLFDNQLCQDSSVSFSWKGKCQLLKTVKCCYIALLLKS